MALFRAEAIANRSERLTGDVAIAVPTSWQALGYLLALVALATAAFLGLASYSRVETATGMLVPDKGLIAIIPTRAGSLSQLGVVEGQRVSAGQLLAAVQVAEAQADGRTATQDVQRALDQQAAAVAAKTTADADAISAQRSQLAAQEQGLASELAEDDAQIALQKAMVSSASQDLAAARSVAAKGFLSLQEMRSRENALQAREQQLAQLEATRANQQSSLIVAHRSEAQLAAQVASNEQEAATNKAALDQQKATLASQGSYVLRAPVAGEVTELVAKPGEAVAPDKALLQIVPTGAALRAQLMIGSDAIGFVKPGQEVHLAVDAFPFEKFGSIPGRVETVAKSPVPQLDATGATKLVYPAVVRLGTDAISAFGVRQPLVPGMTLNARIVTARQSLLQWLFEPIFAVWRR